MIGQNMRLIAANHPNESFLTVRAMLVKLKAYMQTLSRAIISGQDKIFFNLPYASNPSHPCIGSCTRRVL